MLKAVWYNWNTTDFKVDLTINLPFVCFLIDPYVIKQHFLLKGRKKSPGTRTYKFYSWHFKESFDYTDICETKERSLKEF